MWKTRCGKMWRHFVASAPAVVAVLMLGAVFYSAQQSRYSRQALESVIRQSVTAGMGDLVKAVADKPELAKANYRSFKDLPTDKVQALILADAFLTQFEQMIGSGKHVPNREYGLWLNSMHQLFREIPVLHEWMQMTRDQWSDQLWEIARQSQPEGLPVRQGRVQGEVPMAVTPMQPGPNSGNIFKRLKDSPVWGLTVDSVQLVLMVIAVVALLIAATQTCATRESLRSLVVQGLTDTASAGIRDMLLNPDLARGNYIGFDNVPPQKVQGYLLADMWFLHWENVLAQKDHLPKRTVELYDKAIGHIFRHVPVLHEWIALSGDMWSEELLEIARRNRPNTPPPAQPGDSAPSQQPSE